MPMTDSDLERAIREYPFERREGRSVLPPRSDPLGQRLADAVVDRWGGVRSALPYKAQAALRDQGFKLAPSKDGRKTGLASDTAVVDRWGGVHSALPYKAQAALRDQGFKLAPSKDGRKTGLASDTAAPASPGHALRGRPAAQATALAPGGSGQGYTGPGLPRMPELDVLLPETHSSFGTAQAAALAPGGSGQGYTGPGLPRMPELDVLLPETHFQRPVPCTRRQHPRRLRPSTFLLPGNGHRAPTGHAGYRPASYYGQLQNYSHPYGPPSAQGRFSRSGQGRVT